MTDSRSYAPRFPLILLIHGAFARGLSFLATQPHRQAATFLARKAAEMEFVNLACARIAAAALPTADAAVSDLGYQCLQSLGALLSLIETMERRGESVFPAPKTGGRKSLKSLISRSTLVSAGGEDPQRGVGEVTSGGGGRGTPIWCDRLLQKAGTSSTGGAGAGIGAPPGAAPAEAVLTTMFDYLLAAMGPVTVWDTAWASGGEQVLLLRMRAGVKVMRVFADAWGPHVPSDSELLARVLECGGRALLRTV